MNTNFLQDIVPIGDLKINPGKVLKQADKTQRTILVTSHGRGVAVIESLSEFEIKQEKMEFMKVVVQGMTDAEAGKLVNMDDLKKRLYG